MNDLLIQSFVRFEFLYGIPDTRTIFENNRPVYFGVAERSALTSAPVWRILKIYYDADGNPVRSGTSIKGVIWDDYLTVSYS